MNTRSRKQAEEPERQYTVFSSSELLPITATLSAGIYYTHSIKAYFKAHHYELPLQLQRERMEPVSYRL